VSRRRRARLGELGAHLRERIGASARWLRRPAAPPPRPPRPPSVWARAAGWLQGPAPAPAPPAASSGEHARALARQALTAARLRDPRRPRRPARVRARLIGFGLLFLYALLGYRLYGIQIVEHTRWAELADRQHTRLRTIEGERGRLLIRDGRRLVPAAVSLEKGSLLVEGRPDRDVDAFVADLDAAVGLTPDERADVRRRLERGRAFYFRRRELGPEQVAAIEAVGLPRAHVEREAVRAHPFGGLASQTLGLVSAAGEGATGLEVRFDEALQGTAGLREVRVDNRRRELVRPGLTEVPARPGADVVLALDRSAQAIAEAELRVMADEHSPQGAACVVVDVRTGDVLALASWPAFDPHDLDDDFEDALPNRCVAYTYEPGSTIKPLLVGMAWELGLGAPDWAITCPRRLKVPGRRKRIVDSHEVGQVREEDVIVQSSNTGAFQITSRLAPEQLRRTLASFGLGRRSGVEVPGESRGSTTGLARHDPTTLGSVAQGYAVSVTPLQMAMAYAALANGGTLYRPRLVLRVQDRAGQALQTVEARPLARPLRRAIPGLHAALTRVVNDSTGTARRARSDVYTVAGKTGTTKLLVDGRYHEREVVASFCGFAPAEEPRIAFAVVVWGPSTEERRAWGGTVAAPVAGRVAEQVLRIMRVRPTRRADDSGAKK